MSKGPEKINKFLNIKQRKKLPAYQWQDLALQVIEELKIPNFKRNSVFKVAKENNRQFVLQCLNDTKELCQKGEKWKYFFKVVSDKRQADKKTESRVE